MKRNKHPERWTEAELDEMERKAPKRPVKDVDRYGYQDPDESYGPTYTLAGWSR